MAGRRLTKETQEKLIELVKSIQDKQRENSEFIERLRAIDIAYAKQKIDIEKDTDCLATSTTEAAIKVPVVASEVDTVAAELINIFANSEPLMGVISDKGNPDAALKFQALLSRDARQQGWARQIALLCTQAPRYNIAGIEVDNIWQKDVELSTDIETDDPKFEAILNPVSALRTVDMYNALFDYRVAPADIATHGEYAGYNELYTRSRLKTLGNVLSKQETVYNATEAYKSNLGGAATYWNVRPTISDISPLDIEESDDWINWLGIIDDEQRTKLFSDAYLVTKLYVRVIPSEVGLSTSAQPIIVKLVIINNEYIFSYKEIVTPLDTLPIFFCDLREDGFGYQTYSVGENVKPYQDMATTLFDIRLQGSQRALGDRAIYDSEYLEELQVNQKLSDAKIPLISNARNSGDRPALNDLYYPIPFDASGTISAMQDMNTILAIKDDVNGTNFTRRGEQVPGNRTLGEFNTLNAASSNRVTPYALRLEEQIFVPLRLTLKMFTLSSGNAVQKVYDSVTEQTLEVNLAELRQAMLEYRITGGLRNKNVVRDPTVLSSAFQLVQNDPELRQLFDLTGLYTELFAAMNIDVSKHKRDIQTNGTLSPEGSAPALPPGTPIPGGA